VRPLEKDWPELLTFFDFPRHLWRKLHTTHVIARCFLEVRRRTRPMVCFVNPGTGESQPWTINVDDVAFAIAAARKVGASGKLADLVLSVDRIIEAIVNGLNQNPQWKIPTLRLSTHAA